MDPKLTFHSAAPWNLPVRSAPLPTASHTYDPWSWDRIRLYWRSIRMFANEKTALPHVHRYHYESSGETEVARHPRTRREASASHLLRSEERRVGKE